MNRNTQAQIPTTQYESSSVSGEVSVDCTNSPLGTAVNLAIEKLAGYWRNPNYPTQPWFCLLWKLHWKCRAVRKVIFEPKETGQLSVFSHTSPRTPVALKPCRSVMIAAHTLLFGGGGPEWQNLGRSAERDTVAETCKETFEAQGKGHSDKTPLSWDK